MKFKLTNFSFLICAALACIGTYITLGQTGIFKFLFLAPLCAFAIGFIKDTSVMLKISLFSLFALIYAFVFLEGERRVIAFLAMVAIIILGLLFGRCVNRSKEKRIFILPSMICAIASLAVCAFVFGMPTTAISIKAELDEYVSSTYAEDEFIVEDFGYNGTQYGYSVTAKNDRTAYGLRIYKARSGYIADEYMVHLKKSLMRPIVEEIITVLRENHPNDGFSIYGKELNALRYPLSVNSSNDYSENMDIYFYVSNEMLVDEFVTVTRGYFEEIIDAGIKFNTITFIGGEKGQKTFELTAHYGYAANTFDKLLEKHDYIEFSLKHIDFK